MFNLSVITSVSSVIEANASTKSVMPEYVASLEYALAKSEEADKSYSDNEGKGVTSEAYAEAMDAFIALEGYANALAAAYHQVALAAAKSASAYHF